MPYKKGDKLTRGPGRALNGTPKHLIGVSIRETMKSYISSGEASADFQTLRTFDPAKTLDMAMDRIEGRPKQSVEVDMDENMVALITRVKSDK